MRTEEITIYQYSELSEAAQAKARDWWRQASQDDIWWDATFDDAKQIGALMGFDIDKIYFSGFCSQGDGACFEGRLGYAKGCVKAIKAYAPLDTDLHAIAKEWQSLQAANFYQVTGQVRHSGRYQHSGCTSFDIERDGQWASDDLEQEVKDCARSFMDWIYNRLERDYNAMNSDDNVAENIILNEYEFEADGSKY